MLDELEVEKPIKIIFMGTPEFSVPVLEALIDNYKVRAIVTQPDKEIGRQKIMSASPVKKVGIKHTILVLQPEKLKTEYDEILDLDPDLIITCAYGQMVPDVILNYPKYGCINVHASLLPKLRGGAPIHRAIMNGFSKTGITIMHMASKMDAGDIISQEEVLISDTDTTEILHDKLKELAATLLIKTLPSILDGSAPRIKQNEEEVTFGFAIKREDERINFAKTKREIHNQIRGLNSWPGAYCMLGGHIIKVWESYITDNVYPNYFDGQITNVYKDGFGVKVSNGEIVFTKIQPEGKSKMNASDFVKGYKENIVGKILS
jgi:methionyl-tRNA formyltransferase